MNTYFIDNWNSIDTEAAQDAVILIYDVEYDNIRKHNREKFNIL